MHNLIYSYNLYSYIYMSEKVRTGSIFAYLDEFV